MQNTNEKIKVGIDIINRKAMALKKDDWSQLSDQLRDLRKYLHDLEYWLDGELRVKKEVEAKQKAQAIIDAGFTFESVIIDRVKFQIDNGKTANIFQYTGPPPADRQDDNIPF